MTRRDTHESAHDQAAQWLMKLREVDALSGDDLQAWQRFIDVPENLAAFEDVQRAVHAARNLARPPLPSAEELAADRYDGSVPVSDWQPGDSARLSIAWWRRWLGGPMAIGVTAVVTLAMVGALIALLQGPFADKEAISAFKTGAGELREVTLPDGSTVSLGARSVMSVHYSSSKRVVFFEQGDALFTVAHNRDRPFQVIAGGGTVTAVGTQFNVKHSVDQVTVTVTEGAVEVTPLEDAETSAKNHQAAAAWGRSRVSRGEQLTFEDDGSSSGVGKADARRATAWRQGRLEYLHVPLKYVVADVNRYFSQQVVLGDTVAGQLEFTGTVFQNQPLSEWLRALESIFEVRVSQTDEQHVLIQSTAVSVKAQP